MYIQMRFLLPPIAMLSIVATYSFERLREGGTKVYANLLMIPLLFSFFFGIRPAVIRDRLLPNLPVAFGFETKEKYLRRAHLLYNAFEYIDRNLPKSSKIISPFEVRSYYCKRELYSLNMGAYGIMDAIPKTSDQMLKQLKKLGIHYVLINTRYHKKVLNQYRDKNMKLPAYFSILVCKDIKEHYKLLYAENDIHLFEIVF